MPSYVPDPLAIVNLIKRNLQDRYASVLALKLMS